MGIRNRELYLKNCPDWSAFDGCFGGKIRISDVDGFVEISGHCLYIEAKFVGATVKQAQDIAYRNWCRRGDRVIVLFHNQAMPLVVVACQVWTDRGAGPLLKCDTAAVANWFRKWTAWARGEPSLTQRVSP